jgi:hypothetical protein
MTSRKKETVKAPSTSLLANNQSVIHQMAKQFQYQQTAAAAVLPQKRARKNSSEDCLSSISSFSSENQKVLNKR